MKVFIPLGFRHDQDYENNDSKSFVQKMPLILHFDCSYLLIQIKIDMKFKCIDL